MEGHVLSVFGKNEGKFRIPKIKFPVLSLLVSGGHTQLILTKKWMKYEIIGETLDDAVGEAFDKVARMLGLPYPGGPQISKLAEERRGKQKAKEKIGFSVALPRPMLRSKNFDFSFSGLKTAVLYLIKKISPNGHLSDEMKSKIALEFENAAIECLVYKTAKAAEKYKIKTLVVAGGVAANKHLRREMTKIAGKKIKLLFPTKELATDNSLMIGIAGYLNYIKNGRKVPKPESIKATGNLRL
jgi:N6-L-threonylcarbamoyladenine synthase